MKLKLSEQTSTMRDRNYHREIGYSVGESTNGTWLWSLHSSKHLWKCPIIRGRSKSHAEAIENAQAAIDKFLAEM